jgi:proteasome lid subunit RPN8/RPN11
MSARGSAERPPPGYAPGAWRRFCAGLNGLAEEARLGDPALLARDLAELAAEAQAVALELDPELFELVRLASEPLEFNEDEPAAVADPEFEASLAASAAFDSELRRGGKVEPPRPPHTPRGAVVRASTRRQARYGDALVVPSRLLEEIREHARSVPEGYEIGGRLVVEGRRAIEYVPVSNLADRPGRFVLGSSWRPEPGRRSIVLHSHPSGEARPSAQDLVAAQPFRLAEYGIYALQTDELAVFRIAPDRTTYERLPTVVE